MLIYHKNGEDLKVTQVIRGFEGDKVSTHIVKKKEDIPEKHIKWVDKLKSDQIFVSGNSSVIGNGIFLDNIMTEYTGIKSIHPVPQNTKSSYFEKIRQIEEKYRELWIEKSKTLTYKREHDISAGVNTLSLDEIDEVLDEYGIYLAKEKDKEIKRTKKDYEKIELEIPLLIEQYKDGKPPSSDSEYTMKFPPGNHYSKASEMLSSDIGIVLFDEKGYGVASGSISNTQYARLKSEGYSMTEDGQNFIVDENEYKELRGEFLRMKDMLVEHNNLYRDTPSIQSSFSKDDNEMETQAQIKP